MRRLVSTSAYTEHGRIDDMEVDKPKENENTLEISYPTQLSSSAKTQFLELDESRLFVRYTGKGQHQRDVGISSLNITCLFDL